MSFNFGVSGIGGSGYAYGREGRPDVAAGQAGKTDAAAEDIRHRRVEAVPRVVETAPRVEDSTLAATATLTPSAEIRAPEVYSARGSLSDRAPPSADISAKELLAAEAARSGERSPTVEEGTAEEGASGPEELGSHPYQVHMRWQLLRDLLQAIEPSEAGQAELSGEPVERSA